MTSVGAALGGIVLAAVLAAPVASGERLGGRACVTDGDTLRVGGVAVRPKGLAAPEMAHGGDSR
jgi:endonuclease YncB( thermonuclease family)